MNKWIHNLEIVAADNSWHRWVVALIGGAVLFCALLTTRGFLRKAHAKRAATPAVGFMEVPLLIASHTTAIFMLFLSLYVGLMFIDMPDRIGMRVQNLMIIVASWQVGVWASTGAVAWIDRKQRDSLAHNRAAVGTLGVVGVVVRMLIWTVVLLLTFDNLGVKITTLVAGVGIGGIAIALAIALGIADIGGTVEKIGLKTTRRCSNTGEQIIVSNADLLRSRLHNYRRMDERRVVLTISVTYDTLHDKLERIPEGLRRVIEAQRTVRFERVHFARFSGAAIDFEAVYVMTTSDPNVYMDTQQAINLGIHKYFEREEIEFAQTRPRIVFPGRAFAGMEPVVPA